jgi:UDP-3-O-[3-hydroxymyristoyl] glucosamine N-acyltransferase
MIAGSVTIKENTWVATSIVKNGVTIGKDSLVGLGAVVIRNVQDNKTVYGIPAKEH